MLRFLFVMASISGLLPICNSAGEKISGRTDTTTRITGTLSALSEAEVKDGWVSLFDGQTTKGWHQYGNKPVGKSWKVVDGTLHLDATQKGESGDIVTDEEYDNFHLKLEWKIDSCGNSGIIFNIHEDAALYRETYVTGPEMQVLDNQCHPDAKIIKHRAGDLYDMISCSVETVKPALQWNVAEIKSMNGKLEFYLNGTKVVSTTMWDEGWKKMIAGSKFKGMKDFGTFKKGRIGLQDHGNNVWFRNIKIKKL